MNDAARVRVGVATIGAFAAGGAVLVLLQSRVDEGATPLSAMLAVGMYFFSLLTVKVVGQPSNAPVVPGYQTYSGEGSTLQQLAVVGIGVVGGAVLVLLSVVPVVAGVVAATSVPWGILYLYGIMCAGTYAGYELGPPRN